jgi:hypothetical protein
LDPVATELTRREPSAPAARRTPAGRTLAVTAAVVFLGLALSRLLLHVEKALLLVAAGVFVACALAVWGLARRRRAGLHAAGLVMAWIAVLAALLGITFFVDRGGWLWFRLTGYNVTLPEYLPELEHASVGSFLKHHPTFALDPREATQLVLRRGEHRIDRTVVVPRGTVLTVEPGAVLRFGRGCSLLSYSPVIARGAEGLPIRFTARHPLLKWGVVGVVDADTCSFEHVRFEHGRQARINGLDLFGTLSLLGCRASVRNSEFVNLSGKDGVYVRGGDVVVEGSLFQNTFKDGLDLDGARGEVRDNRFLNCGDEGIDLSRHEGVRVHDNVILDRRGGRIGAETRLDEIRSRNRLGYLEAR